MCCNVKNEIRLGMIEGDCPKKKPKQLFYFLFQIIIKLSEMSVATTDSMSDTQRPVHQRVTKRQQDRRIVLNALESHVKPLKKPLESVIDA